MIPEKALGASTRKMDISVLHPTAARVCYLTLQVFCDKMLMIYE